MHRLLTTARLAAIGLPLALLCGGCAVNPIDKGSLSKDEYRAVFTDVITRSLDKTKKDNLCLPPTLGFTASGADTVEINIDNETRFPNQRLAQLKALESAGLLASTESERTVNNKTQKFATYKRTDKGTSYFSEGTFCYARAEFEHIVKWKGPVVLGEYRAALVYYTVKATHIAEWAANPAIAAAYPTTVPIVKNEPPKVRQVAIDLSSEGWDVAEYSKVLQME
jgi:hypothetical protein